MTEEQRFDYLGIPLNIGDVVVTAETYGRSSATFGFGVVEGFTPKFVILGKYKNKSGAGRKADKKVIVVNNQMAFNQENYPELMI